MKKSKTTERTETATLATAPQTKRYSEAFKKEAVENWIKSGQPGTQIAAELGVSYPSLKEWKSRYMGVAMPEHGDLAAGVAEVASQRREVAGAREHHGESGRRALVAFGRGGGTAVGPAGGTIFRVAGVVGLDVDARDPQALAAVADGRPDAVGQPATSVTRCVTFK